MTREQLDEIIDYNNKIRFLEVIKLDLKQKISEGGTAEIKLVTNNMKRYFLGIIDEKIAEIERTIEGIKVE